MTSAVNDIASMKAGALVTFPPLPAEKPEKKYSSSDRFLWEASGTVGSVFNPRTREVTAAAKTPGLAAASVGITQTAVGEAVEGRITVKPADGSSGVSIPLAPGQHSLRRETSSTTLSSRIWYWPTATMKTVW